MLNQLEDTFNLVVDTALAHLKDHQHLFLQLVAEESHFLRFNHALIRHSGSVKDGMISLTLVEDQKELIVSFPFTGEKAIDLPATIEHLTRLQSQVNQIPANPFVALPQGGESSREVHLGQLLPLDRVAESILPPVAGLDFVGFYSAGPVVRASANSAGQRHWFATELFVIDYSLYTSTETAVKGIYCDREWQQPQYLSRIDRDKANLSLLGHPPKVLEKGSYRVYFAPNAVAALVEMMEWDLGEASLQQHSSAFVPLWKGRKNLSPLVNLTENFRSGVVPRFNENGELAPHHLPLIESGKLVNALVSSRSAQEYLSPCNGATRGEHLRSAEIGLGDLPADRILATLGNGIYLSDLHYLNWSDRPAGRITGMTRFACFWVENGQITQPIGTMRFDDSLYNFWGENLEAITNFRELIPETSTYDYRAIGGKLVPGMIVDNFTFTI